MELLKLLSARDIAAQIVCFLILYFLLRAFVWKPLLRFLDERREKISAEFERIAQQQAKVEELRSGYEQHLRALDETARVKLQEAAAAGQKLIDSARAEAHKAAQSITKKAEADIAQELSRAREQLKHEIAILAVKIAERVIEAKISDEADRRLAEGFLNDIDKLS